MPSRSSQNAPRMEREELEREVASVLAMRATPSATERAPATLPQAQQQQQQPQPPAAAGTPATSSSSRVPSDAQLRSSSRLQPATPMAQPRDQQGGGGVVGANSVANQHQQLQGLIIETSLDATMQRSTIAAAADGGKGGGGPAAVPLRGGGSSVAATADAAAADGAIAAGGDGITKRSRHGGNKGGSNNKGSSSNKHHHGNGSGYENGVVMGGGGGGGGGGDDDDDDAWVAGRSWVKDAAAREPVRTGRGRWLRSARSAWASFVRVVRARPLVLLWPLLVTVALAAAGVAGVLAAAAGEVAHRRDAAAGAAANAATAFEVQLQQVLGPLTALQVLIHFQPDWRLLQPRFDAIARELLAELPVPGAVASLQLTPQGVVRGFYPLKGNEKAVNHNLLADPERRGAALQTIANNALTMQGPIMLLQGFRGAVARTPVFVANATPGELFGAPAPATDCPPDLCYNATTRGAWWGFVSCIVRLADLASGRDARLARLTEQGYDYEFFAPQPAGDPVVIAASPQRPVDPVTAYATVPNNRWTLDVAPHHGWMPSWRAPMLATVVVVSALVGLLVLATLVSRTLQHWLLREMKASNRRLAQEKTRMDVLLARQYNLISCMAEQGGLLSSGGGGGAAASGAAGAAAAAAGAANGRPGGRGGGGGGAATGLAALEQRTLARIEQMRREIGVMSGLSGTGSGSVHGGSHHGGGGGGMAGGDQLQLQELLGEGTFGKVFKGIWRGSTVAIKTMVLPAKMSGAEKRERMAIMEAAISSALSHPNIVQTFTYVIRRAGHHHQPQQQQQRQQPGAAAAAAASAASASAAAADESAATGGFGPQDEAVHSFEVSIVLEFMDRGSLRDALDARAFLLQGPHDAGGLNYAAVLDTAADVAKAMLHLHAHQVVHSDLKVRNVLLKSDGNGRGCVAKVADFGLSVKLDAGDTHVSAFQGTLSHMAPEALLRGHISPAADVYSFGVTMWELYTGGHAYSGVPRALLGHQVAVVGLRPAFPASAPVGYRQLAERCWAAEPEQRPSFGEVLATLQRLRGVLGGATPPLRPFTPRLAVLAARERAELEAAMAGPLSGGGGALGPATAAAAAPSGSSLPPLPPAAAGAASPHAAAAPSGPLPSSSLSPPPSGPLAGAGAATGAAAAYMRRSEDRAAAAAPPAVSMGGSVYVDMGGSTMDAGGDDNN